MNRTVCMLIAGVLGFAVHTAAGALCLNPFGCEPRSYDECLRQAGEAKSEAGARRLLAACEEKFDQQQCEVTGRQWVEHLRHSDGVEAGFPMLARKERCIARYPNAFRPALWVTPQYCRSRAAKLAVTWEKIEPGSGLPRSLVKARQNLRPSLDGMDKWQMLEVLQRVYYPDITVAQLADEAYADSPPEQLSVARFCLSLDERRLHESSR